MVLLYHIIDHMVGNGGTVAVVDITGRFSPSHLMCSRDDLKHIHVFLANKYVNKPPHPLLFHKVDANTQETTRYNFQITLSSVKGYMEYGDHGSKHRPWTSTLVVGENGGDICVVWNGWLTVEKEEVMRYLPGVDVEEAVQGRGQRRKVVDGKGWRAVSERGEWYWWGRRED